MQQRLLGLMSALFLTAGAGVAWGMINPNFTPVHLIGQSGQIIQVEVGPIDGTKLPLTLVKALKGEGKATVLDLAKTDGPQREVVEKALGKGKHAGLLFIGEFKEEKKDDNAPAPEMDSAFIHIGGLWFSLSKGEGGAYTVKELNKRMDATFAGSTDMLARCVQYVVGDAEASIPCQTDTAWATPAKIGKVEGRVSGSMAVDLKGDGKLSLLIMSAGGDRVFQMKDKAMADATAQLKLGSRSLAAAWGNFAGDGRLSLASWDGTSVALWQQAEDGTFSAKPLKFEDAEFKTVVSLHAIDAGGKTALLINTGALLLTVIDGKAQGLGPIPADVAHGSACLVADFDGDGVADILQPFESSSLLYKGQGNGKFAAPVKCEIYAGESPAGMCVGDYDADGLLDVFVAGKERCYIWHNLGGGKFAECLGSTEPAVSGEIGYISKGGGFIAQTCDINNDGRQDVFIGYTNRAPHLFFNRGFRSFGHAHSLDLDEKAVFEPANEGIVAGLIADLNGDGAQDMALVLKNGEVYFIARDTGDRPGLALRASLPVKGASAGPLNFSATIGTRPTGAWAIIPGSEAFIGRPDPGPMTVKWQYPGAKPQEAKMVVEELTRCELRAEGVKSAK